MNEFPPVAYVFTAKDGKRGSRLGLEMEHTANRTTHPLTHPHTHAHKHMALLSVKFKMKVSAENSKSCEKAFALAILSFVARSSTCCSCPLHFDLFCFPFAFHHGAPKIMMSSIKRRRLARVGFLPWPLTTHRPANATIRTEPLASCH